MGPAPRYHRPVPSDDALPHGPHDPVSGTPARRPGSIRRTSTIDSNRPGELHGPLSVHARARDLRTHDDGSTETVGEARIDAEVPDQSTRALGAITTAPILPGLDSVVGAMVGPGFRGKVARAVPDLTEGSLLHLLLDDLPGASLVSGYALMHAGATSFRHQREGFASAQTDLCAGWAGDGFMMTFIRTEGRPPHVVGPAAPPLETDDPLAWHAFDPLGPHATRRRRRLDVWPGDDGLLHVDVHFRDSHLDGDGGETVIHEYTVDATVDPATMVVRSSEATARVLPWIECPSAVASAGRIAGVPVAELRSWARGNLVGTSTCTHLNDTLRGLADVDALAAALGS